MEEIEWCDSPNYGRVCGFACDQVVFPNVKAGMLWEPVLVGMFEKLIRPGSVAIDAGANIGLHSLAMVARQPEVIQVLAFEPHPHIFRCLELNVARDQRIRPINKALGRAKGMFSMPGLIGPFNRNPAGMRMREVGEEFPVEVVSLDALDLLNVSLIKIDVESWEWEVISGALELIKRERPTLIVEILSYENRAEKIDLICGLGYKAEPITTDDLLFTPI